MWFGSTTFEGKLIAVSESTASSVKVNVNGETQLLIPITHKVQKLVHHNNKSIEFLNELLLSVACLQLKAKSNDNVFLSKELVFLRWKFMLLLEFSCLGVLKILISRSNFIYFRFPVVVHWICKISNSSDWQNFWISH